MLTGRIRVAILRRSEITLKVVNDTNYLLKRQHGKANQLDSEQLTRLQRMMKIVVAWNDDDRVIGLGVLVKVQTLSHTYASIHNLAVHDGCDATSIGKRIVDELLRCIDGVEFTEASVWPRDTDGVSILTAAGFKLKAKRRYRTQTVSK